MRNVLAALAGMRKQKLEMFYSNKGMTQCSNFTEGLEKDKCVMSYLPLPGLEWNELLAYDFPVDRCRTNQIVFGHAVRPGFVERYHVSNKDLKWIAMMRKPGPWVHSTYKEMVGMGRFLGTFDEWVRSGEPDKVVKQYLQFFVPLPTDDNLNVPLEKRLQERMGADNVLTLFTENFTQSISRLAGFLGASSREIDAMIEASNQSVNVRPTKSFSMNLSQSSVVYWGKALQPLRSAYKVAREFAYKYG